MTEQHVPVLVDVDARHADSAIEAFLTWATPSSEVRVVFTPDVLLGIDTTERRGYIIDEVYFVTVWADRDTVALLDCIQGGVTEGEAAGRFTVKDPTEEARARDLLSLVAKHGVALGTVRHLL